MNNIVGVRLDPEIHRNFKLWCVRRGRTMTDVMRSLIEDWISEQEQVAKMQEVMEGVNREIQGTGDVE